MERGGESGCALMRGKVAAAPCGAADTEEEEEAQACVGDVGGEEVGEEGSLAALGGEKGAEGVEGGEGELRGLGFDGRGAGGVEASARS